MKDSSVNVYQLHTSVAQELDGNSSGVSRVWQAWHVPWAPLWRGRKNCLANNWNLYLQSREPLFWASYIHKLQSCINTARPYQQ